MSFVRLLNYCFRLRIGIYRDARSPKLFFHVCLPRSDLASIRAAVTRVIIEIYGRINGLEMEEKESTYVTTGQENVSICT